MSRNQFYMLCACLVFFGLAMLAAVFLNNQTNALDISVGLPQNYSTFVAQLIRQASPSGQVEWECNLAWSDEQYTNCIKFKVTNEAVVDMLTALKSVRVSRAVAERLAAEMKPYEKGLRPNQISISLDVSFLLSRLIQATQADADSKNRSSIMKTLGSIGVSLLITIVGMLILTRSQGPTPEMEKGVLALLGAVAGYWLRI